MVMYMCMSVMLKKGKQKLKNHENNVKGDQDGIRTADLYKVLPAYSGTKPGNATPSQKKKNHQKFLDSARSFFLLNFSFERGIV